MDLIRKAGRRFQQRDADWTACRTIAQCGHRALPQIMNEFDLLPVQNYRYGSHPEAE